MCVTSGSLSALTMIEINNKKFSLFLLYYMLPIKCSQLLGQKSAKKNLLKWEAVTLDQLWIGAGRRVRKGTISSGFAFLWEHLPSGMRCGTLLIQNNHP